jgi:uncharacterized protein with PhoU and TrkA domain
MGEIPAPRDFAGRTLRQLDVGARYGVQVIFIRSPSGNESSPGFRVPTANARIGEHDSLILAGPKAAVDALEAE